MMTASHLRAIPAIVLALLLAAAAGAEATPDWAGLLMPEAGIAGLAALPSPLGLGELERLGLEASGVAEADMASRLGALGALLSELAADPEVAGAGGEAAKAEACLAFLHRRAFSRYEYASTTLDRLLDTGRYNCVSSACLYLIACRSLGLEVSGVRTTDHAFCVVHAEGRDYDVETTNPYGFDPGSKKEFADAFGKATGYRYVSPGNYAARRPIGEKELFALILSNRIASAEEKGDFRGALGLSASYAALVPGAEGRSLLLDCVGNMAAALASGGAKSAGAEGLEAFVRAAMAELGPDKRLAELLEAAVSNRIQAALAAAFATAGAQDGAWRALVAEAEARRDAGEIGAKGCSDLITYAYSAAAQRLGARQDWLGAAAIAQEGVQRLAAAAPRDRRLEGIAATCISNYVAVSHNAFAALYNGGRYAEALASIEEAIAALGKSGLASPGSRDAAALAADRDTAKRAIAR
jgi:hypothetical protein